ncbi:hypothetical protein QJQ45_030430 [Haematococcus lacustris]|nr:hypothetical protein QJQ45_030430 [Haematococcus lacustris]
MTSVLLRQRSASCASCATLCTAHNVSVPTHNDGNRRFSKLTNTEPAQLAHAVSQPTHAIVRLPNLSCRPNSQPTGAQSRSHLAHAQISFASKMAAAKERLSNMSDIVDCDCAAVGWRRPDRPWREFFLGTGFHWGFLCTPANPLKLYSKHSQRQPPHFFGINDWLGIATAAMVGAQHALAMVGGLIVPPLLIVPFGTPNGDDYKRYLVQAALIVTGLMTLVQVTGIRIGGKFMWGAGVVSGWPAQPATGAPLGCPGLTAALCGVLSGWLQLSVMGVSFTSVPIVQSTLAKLMKGEGMSFDEAYGHVLGTLCVSTLTPILFSFLPIKVLRKVFPPVVSGVTILLIGIHLTGAGLANWGGGSFCSQTGNYNKLVNGVPAPVLCTGNGQVMYPYGDGHYVGMGFLVFSTIILIEILGSPFMRNCSAIIGLLFGYFIAAIIDVDGKRFVTSASFESAPAITFNWTKTFPLKFYGPAIIPLIVVSIITAIESVGDTAATIEASRMAVTDDEASLRIKGALFNDGVSGLFSALATSLPLTTFAQNNGVISLTNVAARQSGWACGLWLILLGILGKVGAFVISIPNCVLGGMTTFLFANVMSSGIKIIVSEGNLDRRTRFIMACSLALGVGVELVSSCPHTSALPPAARQQQHSWLFVLFLGAQLLPALPPWPVVVQVPQWGNYWLWPVTPDMSSGTRGIRDAIALILSTSFCLAAITAFILNLLVPEDAHDEGLAAYEAAKHASALPHVKTVQDESHSSISFASKMAAAKERLSNMSDIVDCDCAAVGWRRPDRPWREFFLGTGFHWGFLCTPANPLKLYSKHSQRQPPHFFGINDWLGIATAAMVGAQHALAMVGGLIVPPLLIVPFGTPNGDDYKRYLVQAALIVTGLMTLVQVTGIRIGGKFMWGAGVVSGWPAQPATGAPLGCPGLTAALCGVLSGWLQLSVMGVSFTSVPIVQSTLAKLMKGEGMSFDEAYGHVLGTLCVSTLTPILFSFLPIKVLRKVFPPVVSGVTILLIGIHLTGAGLANWGGGSFCSQTGNYNKLVNGVPAPVLCTGNGQVMYPYGDGHYVGMGFLVFSTIILIEILGSPFMRNCSAIIGLLFGYFIAAIIDVDGKRFVTSASFESAPAITFNWTKTFPLKFYGPAIIPLIVVSIITAIESVGDTAATIEASRMAVTDDEASLRIKGALFNDGVSGLFSALATSLPLTTFAQNNGVISLTNVAARQSGWACGLWLILLGILGKVGAFVISIPNCVLGGMTTFLFANVMSSGIKIIVSEGNLDRRTRFIMACSLALGVGVELVSSCPHTSALPPAARQQQHSWLFVLFLGAQLLPALPPWPVVVQVPQWGNYWLWPVTPDMSSGTRGIRDAIALILSTSFCLAAITAFILNLLVPEDAHDEGLAAYEAAKHASALPHVKTVQDESHSSVDLDLEQAKSGDAPAHQHITKH